jgi:hypothetical protein
MQSIGGGASLGVVGLRIISISSLFCLAMGEQYEKSRFLLRHFCSQAVSEGNDEKCSDVQDEATEVTSRILFIT